MIKRQGLCLLLAAMLAFGPSGCGTKTGESDPIPEENEAFVTEELSETTSNYSLGSARMVPAEGKSASVFYSPIGGAVFVELKDAVGNQWRLEIPENALPYGETVTMQLCESMETDVVSGKQTSGVILQPEGLQFTLPATLTVSGPIVQEKSCLFFGEGSGEALNFKAFEAEGAGMRLSLSHFSAYIVYTPTGSSEIQEAQALAAEAYKALLAEAKDFLKTPVTAPPLPPDYTFECGDEENGKASAERNRALDAYIRSAMDPEFALADRLLGAGQQIADLGGETDARYYAGQLLNRNLKKADKLFMKYQNDNDKLIPVMNLTFRILKELDVQGFETPGGYTEAFSDWMERAAEEQLKKIREEHDYKALGPAIALVNGGAVLSSDFSASADFTRKYMEKLKKAMTFKVIFDASLYAGVAEQRMKVEGEVEVRLLDANNEKPFTGKGKGKYTSYSHSGPGDTRIDFPNEYSVEMKFIDFSPCDSETVKVQVDKIGSDHEVWYSPTLNEKFTDQYSFVNFMAEQLFSEYRAEAGGFVFEVPFENESAIMGEGTFTKTDTLSYPEEGSAAGSITYSLEIRHTPK